MDDLRPGQLVTLSLGGPALDGIVFATPSQRKVVVAVVDPQRGPGFKTIDPATVTEREVAGAHDPALWGLIRRTPATSAGGPIQSKGSVQGRRGHTRSATHRTTGK
ncbi:MAG: hypothetical protein ABWZ67_05405 [Solirubrobacteraceae bacterium]